MNIIRASGDLAKEFLEQLIEEFELELATSGTIDPHDEYAGHYHGLDADRDAYIEGIQSESYSGIYRELDSFLLSKGLNVKKNSQEYMALARRFMQAKIKALAIMMEICQGKSYEYTITKAEVAIKPTARNKRKITIRIESYIDVVLPEVLKYATELTKFEIAEEVAIVLEEDYKIIRKPSAVLSEYLQNHPLMK